MLQAQDTAKAQDANAQPPEPYQITVTLKITDHGKLTTDQTFTLAVANHVHGGDFDRPSVRDGDRVPIVTGGEGSNLQFQYVDVGTNIDVQNLLKLGSLLEMTLRIESSTAVPSGEASHKDLPGDPILRTLRYTLVPIISLGKLTTIYSSGDGVSSQKVEIQLLANPLGAK
jgi:hypothetical protein